MPHFSGLDALHVLKEKDLDLPFIIVSGAIGEDIAVEAMRAGAHDYVLKGNLARLLPAVERELREARERLERKRAERALRESQELYEMLVLASPDAVTKTDLEGKVTYASHRTAELHGYDSNRDIIGLNAFDLIAPEYHEVAVKNLKRTLEEGTSGEVEYEFLKRDGSRFIGELIAVCVKDAEGEPEAFIATTRDITERKRLEMELQRVNIELQGFAHTVSHDLKGPISAMDLAGETIRELLGAPPTEETRKDVEEMLEILSSSSQQASSLIEDLLSFARVDRERREVSEVDVGDIVVGVLEERKRDIDEKGIEVKVVGDMGKVRAERTHIYQVFSNLVGNAIRHNTSSNPEIQVRHLGDEGNIHRYLVRDNGPGIPEGAEEYIFLPFRKGDLSDGSGIGLSIVDKIVRGYGGEITVYNDSGACFEFTLRTFDDLDR